MLRVRLRNLDDLCMRRAASYAGLARVPAIEQLTSDQRSILVGDATCAL